jgi:hemoglobin/transferrin/lactoferrin receptor protein
MESVLERWGTLQGMVAIVRFSVRHLSIPGRIAFTAWLSWTACIASAEDLPKNWVKVAAMQSEPTPTLPELEVRPPSVPAPAPPSEPSQMEQSVPLTPSNASAPSTLGTPSSRESAPSTSSASIAEAMMPRTSANRSLDSQAFPSLRAQKLGASSLEGQAGLNSVLRSSSSLFELPQSVSIIDRQTLDRRQSNTMFRALQNEVGVLLQQTGNGQLSPFIRGLTGQHVLVLVDGIRMNTSILRAGPNQYTSTVDPGMIDRIEIIRGAESAMWGSDAIGGAINIVTRSANSRRGDHLSPIFSQYYSTAEASTYTRTGFGGWYGKTGVIGGVSYLDTGLLDRGGSLGRQPATDYEQFAGDIKLQRILGESHVLTVALQHFEQEDLKRSDRFLPFVLGPAPNGSIPTQRPSFFDPQQRNLGYVRLEGLIDDSIPFADAYSVTLSGMRTKEGSIVDRYPNNQPTSLANRREIGEFDNWGWGTTLAASKDAGDYGKLTYGGDFYDENIDSFRRQINNPTNPNATATNIDPQYPDDAQADRVGTFLSWNVLLTSRLDMTTSIRYENINVSGTPNFSNLGLVPFERTYQDWIGSVGMSYRATDNFRLIGGVYEGFRAPTIDDLTANKVSLQNAQSIPIIGNLDVQPEHSYTYEVGFKLDDDHWRLQLVEFWTDFDSYIGRQITGNNEFLTNQEAMLNGTELNGEYLLNQDVSLYGNFYYTYGDLITTNDFFPRIPPTQGILGLRLNQPIRKSYVDIFAWMVRRADRYSNANLSDSRFIQGGTPGYATLNIRTGRVFGHCNRHQVSLSLENLTDKYYRVLGSGVDGAGFNAVFGYQYAY